jgi:hypothetical protein
MAFNEVHFRGFEKMGRTFRARKRPVKVDVHGPIDRRREIRTREGTVVAEPGDYIIRGVDGEVYPIGAEIFHETYEVLDE